MNILIIPDVHGRKFWRQALEVINKVNKVVFLGDYLDPYDVTEEEALDEFKAILEFKQKYPDKVILLIGNHDLEYLWPDKFNNTCRHCYDVEEKAQELYRNNEFQLIYIQDNYLFSHAGVTKGWLGYVDLTLEDLKILDFDLCKLDYVGWRRGGLDLYPSCVWCDILEFRNDLDYYQIFGHTQLKSEHISDKFACLDARKCFILKEGKIDVLSN